MFASGVNSTCLPLSSRTFQEKFQLQRTRALWLAVHEDCIALLERHSLATLVTYDYSEVSTFGGHREDFVLVVSPKNTSPTHNRVVQMEKIVLTMSKIQVYIYICIYIQSYAYPGILCMLETYCTVCE